MIVYLLRHGRTEANDRHLYCGSTDLSLSDRGRSDLAALRARIAYPELTNVDAIISGLRRTAETFQMLYGDAPARVCAEFREIDFGAFEMHSYEELKQNPAYQAWIGDAAGDAAPPKGESANHFRDRVIAAAEALRRDSLIVCHGGVIAALMAHWFPEENRHMYAWQPDFGCGYRVEILNEKRTYTQIG